MLEELIRDHPEIFATPGVRCTKYAYDEKHFGNAILEVTSNAGRFRLIRDRLEYTLESWDWIKGEWVSEPYRDEREMPVDRPTLLQIASHLDFVLQCGPRG